MALRGQSVPGFGYAESAIIWLGWIFSNASKIASTKGNKSSN